jgi:hypothetical protein
LDVSLILPSGERADKTWFTAVKNNPEAADPTVTEFVNELKEGGLRWGGNFTNPFDPIHFDDGLSMNPVEWQQRYNFVQQDWLTRFKG